MKRNRFFAGAFALILAAAGSSVCRAQEVERNYWQAEFGISYGLFDRSGLQFAKSEIRLENYERTNDELTSTRSPVVLPVFTLSAGYVMPKSHLGVFMNASVNYAYCNLDGGPSRLSEREPVVHVLPGVRMYYMSNSHVKLYGALGLGVRYRRYSELYKGDRAGYNDWQLSYLVSPIGVEVGSNVFFSLEAVAWGTAYTPFLMKVGYRF